MPSAPTTLSSISSEPLILKNLSPHHLLDCSPLSGMLWDKKPCMLGCAMQNHAWAPSVHQMVPAVPGIGGSSMLANCPLVWEAATVPPAAPSQGLCCTLWMLAGEGVIEDDHYLSTPGQILLSFLASGCMHAARQASVLLCC